MVENKVRISLSHDLRKKYHIRSFPVAKGDIVTVRTGGRKEEGGKVIGVNHSHSLVSIEGLSAVKADGKQTEFWIRPDKLLITRIDLSRKDRIEELKRLGAIKKVAIDRDIEEERQKQEEEERAQKEAEEKEAEKELPEETAEAELPEPSEEEPQEKAEEATEPEEEENDEGEVEESDADAEQADEDAGEDLNEEEEKEDDKQD